MPAIHFLIDENVPHAVVVFLRGRGHVVAYVGEALAKSSPDPILLAAAEEHGLVVVTFDKDFRRLIKQVPQGGKAQFTRRAGRISLRCDETIAARRIEEMITMIEFWHAEMTSRGKRFIM